MITDKMMIALIVPVWGIMLILSLMLDILMRRLPKFKIDISIEKASKDE